MSHVTRMKMIQGFGAAMIAVLMVMTLLARPAGAAEALASGGGRWVTTWSSSPIAPGPLTNPSGERLGSPPRLRIVQCVILSIPVHLGPERMR